MIYHRCSYCHREIRPAEEGTDGTDIVSHGICRSCLEKIMAGCGQSLDDFIDALPQPVFVVDSAGRIITANLAARETLGNNKEQLYGRLEEELYECGQTNCGGGLCRSCVIRNAVMETFADGKSRQNVVAYHALDIMAGMGDSRFLISTEKAGDVVLLRIDEVSSEDADTDPSDEGTGS